MTSRGPFIDALLASEVPVVMEVKRRDGHGADLLGDRTIAEIVADYAAAGAPCISVVTGRWFGGELSMLAEVAGLTDRPLLQKDFIVRQAQIAAAKETGAAAVLLTARVLPKRTLPDLIELTLESGLTPFVEVADRGEIGSLVRAEECVVAVNNKDIGTRERDAGDLDLSRELLEATLATGTPCPVSASAISDPAEAAELIAAGFKGLLIGAGLLRAASVADWVASFTEHRRALAARGATAR